MTPTPDQPPKTPKRGGRPRLKIDAEAKAQVAELAKLGFPHELIAFKQRISIRSLRKHFRAELYDPAIEANKQVLTKLLELALTGNPSAAALWTRTRCQFPTPGSSLPEVKALPPVVEIVNNDGAPREDW
jgi:hypothetical protein